KEGRIRHNLMGKRVDHSARTVIGAGPTLKMDEVAIPYEVAQTHTKPEVVNTYNIKYLTELVNNGKANYVIQQTPSGKKRINLKHGMFKKGTTLLYGDILIRGYKSDKSDKSNKSNKSNKDDKQAINPKDLSN